MYRDDYPVMHDAFAGVVAEPECINGCFPEAAFLEQIGVSIVKVLERERERRICALGGFRCGRFDVQICSHLTGCKFSREPTLLTFALGIHQSERRVHCRQKNAWHAVAARTTKYA